MASPRKAASKPRTRASVPAPASGPAFPKAAALPADVIRDLALLAAANNLMAQTAFLAVERMRITSEVVDESVSDDFGAQLFDRCEKLVQASDAAILRLLDRAGAQDEASDLVRGLIRMRGEFAHRARKPREQRRLLESMERMYR